MFLWSLAVCGVLSVSTSEEAEDRAPQLVLDGGGFNGEAIRDLAISNDGRLLVAAAGKLVRIWDLKTGQLLHTLRGYQEADGFSIGRIHKLRISANSRYLLVGVVDNSFHGSTRMYDLQNPGQLHRLLPGQTGCTKGVAFAPSGQVLAAQGCGGFPFFWKVKQQGEEAVDKDPNFQIRRAEDYEWKATSPWVSEIFDFLNSDDWLLARYRDTTMVHSVSTKRSLKHSQWPREVLEFLELERKLTLPFDSAQCDVSCSNLAYGDRPWIALGGNCKGRTTSSPYVYWIGVWSQGARPQRVWRDLHFHPTAVTVNPKAGIVAGADSLGNLYVWNLWSDEQRTTERILPPKNRSLFRVAWSEQGDCLYFADESYQQDRFHFNRYGSPRSGIQLRDRRIVTLSSELTATVSEEEGFPQDAATGLTLFPEDRADGKRYLLVRDAAGKTVASRESAAFGKPMSFAFCPRKSRNQIQILVGSDTGRLEQWSLANWENGRGRLDVERVFVGHQQFVTSLSFAPDGKTFASASTDGTLRLWDLASRRPAGDLDVETDGNLITGVTPGSPAALAGIEKWDRILTLAGQSFYARRQRIARGELRTGQSVRVEWLRGDETLHKDIRLTACPDIVEPYLSFYLTTAGSWVAWTPKGFFDSSPDGEEILGWHVNQGRDRPAKFFPVSEFRQQLGRPDVLDETVAQGNVDLALAKLDNDPERSVLRRPTIPTVRELDLTKPEIFDQVRPPEIRILKPEPNAQFSEAKLPVEVEIITHDRTPLANLGLRLNNRALAVTDERVETLGQRERHLIRATVELEIGDNTISVRAENISNQAKPAVVHVVRRGRPAADKARPNLYVLAVGVSDYPAPDMRLKYADADARDFAALWQVQAGGLYSEVTVKVLVNEEATVSAVRNGFDWLQDQTDSDPEAIAFILLSGHGVMSPLSGVWHFATSSAAAFAKVSSSNSITHSEVLELLNRRIRCNAVLFVDSCHAAEAGRIKGAAAPGPWNSSTGRCVFAGSMPAEKGLESREWGHGAFVKAILEAFQPNASSGKIKSDPDENGRISASELSSFVKAWVRDNTGDLQHPVFVNPADVSDFDLGLAGRQPMQVGQIP